MSKIVKAAGTTGYYASGTSTFTCNSSITRHISCSTQRQTMSTSTPTPNDLNNTHSPHTVNRCRYKLIVAYDGTRFHGFQRQIDNETMMKQYNDKKLLASLRPKKRPHYYDIDTATHTTCDNEKIADIEISRIRKGCNISVQEVLEFVLLDMYNLPKTLSTVVTVQDISLTFAGRTDKGVHANGQVCLVQLPSSITTNYHTDPSTITADNNTASTAISHYDFHCWKLRNDMNSRLPLDVSVQHVSQLPDDTSVSFDPRRDVKRKTYTYNVRYRRCGTQSPTNIASTTSDRKSNTVDNESELHRMIEQSGGPHSIRNATDTYCLWIVPWVLCNDDTILPKLCQQFMGAQQNFYYFIHKADRDNPKKTTMHTIHEMSYEVISISTECISSVSSRQGTSTVSSEIVTGRFTFIAKSFRRTMIRNIVGYCIDACRSNLANVPSIEFLLPTLETTAAITSSKTHNNEEKERHHYIINAAPASGLCLESVVY
jgi:tRNA pseudouridine(38-40) synthase